MRLLRDVTLPSCFQVTLARVSRPTLDPSLLLFLHVLGLLVYLQHISHLLSSTSLSSLAPCVLVKLPESIIVSASEIMSLNPINIVRAADAIARDRAGRRQRPAPREERPRHVDDRPNLSVTCSISSHSKRCHLAGFCALSFANQPGLLT